MAELSPPAGAVELEAPPKAAAPNKLVACLDALSMQPRVWQLRGGQILILGLRSDLKLALQARFEVGVSPTGKPSAKFDYAQVLDPVGVVQNLEFDYSINKPNAKRLMLSEDRARRVGLDRNARYNDGAQALVNKAEFSSASAMNEWLDDWLDLLKIDHKRQSAKKRATRAEQNQVAIMTGGTWVG